MKEKARSDRRANIDAQSRLTGVIGYPLSSTLSPLINNVAFGRMDLNWVYIPLRVAPGMLAAALAGLSACGFAGVNVTIPHKLEACRLADELVGDAAATGSVNTLSFDVEAGRITGYSTDGLGFVRALQEAVGDVPRGDLFVLGAGGAARAVAYALAATGRFAVVSVCNRTPEKAVELAALVSSLPGVESTKVLALDADNVMEAREALLVVNTLPSSEVDITGLAKASTFAPGQVVADLDYRAERSPLLRLAEQAGCTVVNGRGMLVHQAAESLRIWTGREAPAAEMRAALDDYLAGAPRERTG